MNNPFNAACLTMLMALSMQACDININTSNSSSVPDIALTITAQAAILQHGYQQPVSPSNGNPPAGNPPAQINPSSAESTPTNTPGPVSATATNTPFQGGPVTVTVTVETNCRTGPSLSYESIYSMSVSDVAEVIGKNTSTNYWVIKIPNGGGATCWLWGKYANVTGDSAALVEVATPTPLVTITNTPDPTPSRRPAAPSNLQVEISCVDQGNKTYKISGTISWTDNSNDELGFTVLYPGNADAVAPNTTSHNFDFTYSKNQTIQFGVQALGKLANSATVNITTACP